MKRIWLLGLLVQPALCASFPLDPASARITEQEELIAPASPTELEAVRIAGPFEFPWSIAFLPDNSILVTERPGRLQLIQPGSVAREVAGLPPILNKDHAGLLDVAIDPGFAENRIVYLSYVHGTAAASTIRVLRAKLDENRTLIDPQRHLRKLPGGAQRQATGRPDSYYGRRLSFSCTRRPLDAGTRSGSLRSCRLDHSHPYRWFDPQGQPVHIHARREVGNLELWPSQPSRTRD